MAMSNAFYNTTYDNDGTGRDTFINHAGAYWLNPLPGGLFYKSRGVLGDRPSAFEDTAEALDGSVHPYNTRYPGRTLYGKSRYGTCVAQRRLADDPDGTADGSADASGRAAGAGDGASADGFDPEETALDRLPYDVADPERRLRQPGHATTGLDPTDGTTFNATTGPWEAPRAVDNTYLRLERIYESTCHYGLRTGRFYTDDQAPAHEGTLPIKGVNWGKSRYYP